MAANCRNQLRLFCNAGNNRPCHVPTWLSIDATSLHKDCVRDGEYYWGDANGGPVCLNGLLDTVHSNRLHDYLAHRDDHREGPARWLDGTYALAALVYNDTDKSVTTTAQSSRIIFNKHWHGGNRGKMKTADDEERTLNMQCHLCGDMDSQDHLLQHCTHPDVCVVRRGALDMLEALGR